MGHTNSTTNYSLPQFVTTDKPAWLTDINGAFSAIDTGLHTAQTDATTAKNTADSAQSDATAAGTAASTADGKATGAIASIANAFDTTSTYNVGDLVMYNNLLYICSTAVTTPGSWTGSTNWTRTTVENQIPLSAAALPIGSSTPSGSTAEAIKGHKAISYTSAETGIGTNGVVIKQVGKYLFINIDVIFTSDFTNTWVTVLKLNTHETIVDFDSMFGTVTTDSTSYNSRPCQVYMDSDGYMVLRIRNPQGNVNYRGQLVVPVS